MFVFAWILEAWAGVALGDGAVAVPEAGWVFVAGEGGVSAIRLRDGSVAWTSRAGDLPLDADASRVVVWDASEPRQLEIVSLDVGTGEVLARCPARPTPEGWALSLDSSLNGSSWVSAQLDGDQIRAWWGGETHFAGGEMPLEATIIRSNRSWLDSGRCVDGRWVEEAAGPAPQSSRVPQSLIGRVSGGVAVGDRWVDVVVDLQTHLWRARTWRVSTGEPLADRSLGRWSSSSASALVSADGSHVAINSYTATPSSVLYRVVDGAKVMDLPRAVAPGFVLIGRSCVMMDTGLVAYGSDGVVLWTQPVHDRSYHGPRPQ